MSEAVYVAEERSVERLCKEILDRSIAFVLLLALSPVLLLVAILISLTSSGPILYRRRVLGLHGTEFDAFKLRTMVADADRILRDEPGLLGEFQHNMKLRKDPRSTFLGRFLRRSSLDEVPQLFNVLRGEMSLVGPRMITQEETARFGETLVKRLSVKPGITGLWQVSGRQELDYSERVRLDQHYVENWSFWLDLVILAKTIPAVLSMKGAY